MKLKHNDHEKNKFVSTCTACIVASYMSDLGKESKRVNLKRNPNYYKDLRAKGVAKQRAAKLTKNTISLDNEGR